MNKNRNKFKKRKYNNSKVNNNQKNNFQDKAEGREYKKGFRAGKEDAFTLRNGKVDSAVSTETGAKDNNPEWYIPNQQIAKDVASISFDAAIGRPLTGKWANDGKGSFPAFNQPVTDIPGIMTLSYVPSIGAATSPLDGVNVGADALYTYIRAQINKSNTIYEKSDVIKYILALDGPYAFRSFMIRLYGAMTWISVVNRYTPQYLVNAMGVSYKDLSQNLAEFRAFLNQYTLRLSQFPIPKDITYIVRHVWMNENIFKDANNNKAQMYMYAPSTLYMYQEGTDNTINGSKLVQAQVIRGRLVAGELGYLKFKDIMDIANSLLQPIIQSQDMQFIAGDILKAFGSDSMINMNMIAENFTIQPIYSEEVLSQIENAEIAPDYVYSQVYEKTGINEGYLVEEIGCLTDNLPWPYKREGHIINFHHENPSPEDVIVASRLMYNAIDPQNTVEFQVGNTTRELALMSNTGSEVLDAGVMFYINTNYTLVGWLFREYNYLSTQITTRPNFSNWNQFRWDLYENLTHSMLYASFDWAPKMHWQSDFLGLPQKPSTDASVWISQSATDYDVVAEISEDVLEHINSMAMLKQFNVPNMSGLTFR
nr:capsid protein [Rat picobirnavirus]